MSALMYSTGNLLCRLINIFVVNLPVKLLNFKLLREKKMLLYIDACMLQVMQTTPNLLVDITLYLFEILCGAVMVFWTSWILPHISCRMWKFVEVHEFR